MIIGFGYNAENLKKDTIITLTTLANRSKRFIRAPRAPPRCLQECGLPDTVNLINSTLRAPTATRYKRCKKRRH